MKERENKSCVCYICINFVSTYTDLQELLLLSKESTMEELGMMTPPSSDANSDSEASLPGSPAYEEMGKSYSYCKHYKYLNKLLVI